MSTKARTCGAGQQIHSFAQAGQMLGQHRVELAGVTEGELPQQGSHGGGGIHPVEEGFHAAGADQVDIVDVVRAGAHARDQGGQFRSRVG